MFLQDNCELNKKLDRLSIIDKALPKALSGGEFFLHYQPIICLKDRTIIGAEALIRWNSRDLGIVSPDEFIPRAEGLGIIVPLGEWIFRTACFEAKEWTLITSKPIRIGVNFSAQQMAEENIVSFVEDALHAAKLPPGLVDIELTEHSFSTDSTLVIQAIMELKKMGITFSLDDFGTGYSSLSKLVAYPVDTLKIDQSFIAGLVKNKKAATIVRAIAQIAQELELSLLAEGVENQKQIEFLYDLHCYCAQGHFFHRSMGGEDFRMLIEGK